MRLSDILKRSASPAVSPVKAPAVQPPTTPTAPAPIVQPATQQTSPATASGCEVTPAPAVISAETVYAAAIVQAKALFAAFGKNEPCAVDCTAPAAIAALVSADDAELIVLAERATPDIYLYGHSANVCILSVVLGKAAGVEETRLAALALCAFVHDLGMGPLLPLALKNARLSPSELAQIRKHPLAAPDIASCVASATAEMKALIPIVVAQVHERLDGSGYPAGLSGDDIHQFARIIAVADSYEALTHPRPFRDRILPHIALKTLINQSGNAYDPALLRSFIDVLSLYPPGSYVRLNTGEIARVISTHRGVPTRPAVRVVLSSDLRRPTVLRTVDLATTPMVFITEPVDELSLPLSDKKTLLELKAARWWVRGL